MSKIPLARWMRRRLGLGSSAISRQARLARERGDTARNSRNWPVAAAAYRTYLSECPDHAALWVQLGHMLKESGLPVDAERAYGQAAVLDPTDADAQLYHGHALKSLGRMAEAAHAYKTSFLIDGNRDARQAFDEIAPTPGAIPNTASAVSLLPPVIAGRHVGVVDHVAGVEITGWAIDPDTPLNAARIEFRTGDRIIGRTDSCNFRADVALLGMGTTTAGFAATLDLDRRDKTIVEVRAYLQSTGEELEHSPFHTTGYSPFRLHSDGPPITDARFAIAKRLIRPADAETALFVTHSTDGVLKPHVPAYLDALRQAGIHVFLIVVAERPFRMSPAQRALVAGIMVRENVGYDFAAWGHALSLHPEIYQSNILYLVNDSMFGPNTTEAFDAMIARVRSSDADLVGLTENHENGWHVQSFFLALKQTVLRCFAVQNFFASMVNLPDKQSVIDNYELRLAPLVEENGFRCEALFASNNPLNATMFAWRELIEDGFPFVKTLLFRQKSFLFDIDDWEDYLEKHGFDTKVLSDVLKHQQVSGYVTPGFPLLAMPSDTSLLADEPLKVAFYGPWNFDNGLGSASRGIVAALRTTGVRLNLHPVKKSFHIHRPLAPAFDIRDFEGPADVAIVHLNPDSWHILTAEQRREIGMARKRIGYWVWEMGHLPDSWQEEFSSVDRIWAPSGYCGDLFRAAGSVPVDVVPHAVPLPEMLPIHTARMRATAALGLPTDRRIILYVFDGSSYLVRKNPHALVRAFAASGLAARGWSLVLKTKHLMDRPEDGMAFRNLASSVPDVIVIDRALPEEQLRDMFAIADIYASPHCSEGFGLTIAEAMAAAKPVVATDFSGSMEFLDAACGYPVPATPYRLEENFGHYTKGGEWGRIDEDALAAILVDAADAVSRGDHRIGAAARARIADRLSYEAVGSQIDESLSALFADTTPRWPAPRPLDTKLLDGVPLDKVALGTDVRIAPLRAGTFIPEKADELDRVDANFGQWLLIAPADAKIHPHFLSIFLAFAAARPDVAIFYADDIAAGEPDLARQLRLKPEFDATLLFAQDYIGAPLIIRGSALHKLGGFRHDVGAAVLTDLVLRAWMDGMSIARIPFVLLGHPGTRPVFATSERRALLEAHPALTGRRILSGLTSETLQIVRDVADDQLPAVTLLIPTRQSRLPDGTPYVARLLDSLSQTDWPLDRLHILIGDDVPGRPDWAEKAYPFAMKRIETPRPEEEAFNFAAKMNVLWRASETEHVVMLNDDVLADDSSWLKSLMNFAVDDDVGAVGPLLHYENGTIQHAGVVGGLFGLCAHAWLYRPSTTGTYQDWALVHREWSMITGAVLATRRTMLERVNGFDEQFALEFNDLDLCLRLRTTGARIVYTPHARMTHAEKASRGTVAPPARDLALFLGRWKEWLKQDPAFHPMMHRHRFDLEPGYDPEDWFIR